MMARASRPPNFTFLSLPVRHSESRSPDGCQREHSRLDNLTFQVPCLTTLTRPTQWVLISRRTSVRASQLDTLTFSIPRPVRLTHPCCEYPSPVGCRREPPNHTTLPFCLTCSTQWAPISRWTPARALPARQPYLFKSHARRGLLVRHSEYYASVRRRRKPPSQTNLPFHPTVGETYPFDSVSIELPYSVGECLLATHPNFPSDEQQGPAVSLYGFRPPAVHRPNPLF